jgi:hypothetical protein
MTTTEEGQQKSGEQKPDEGKTRTFTQAEFDRVMGQRLASERSRFADYDDLKAAKTELDEIKAKNASELDQAVAKAKSEGISEATTRADQRIVAAAARALAAAANFHDPKDAPRLLDLSKVKVNADGEPDEEAIEALIKDAADKRPYLVKATDKQDQKRLKRDPAQGSRDGEKLSGRELGLAEAERRFGKKS